MIRSLTLLALWLISAAPVHAATVLFSHSGSTDPTTEAWTRSVALNATTAMESAGIDDGGTPTWRIADPGQASGGTGLNFYATMTGTKTTEILSTGWDLSATIKVPGTDPTENVAWATNSNTWLGYLVADDGLGARRAWALMFGRNASGQTIVTTFQNLGVVTRTLDATYHDYSIVYDPLTRLSTVWIDGEIWLSDYAGYNLGAATGQNQVYWGDNSAQNTTQPARAAYYAEVQFTQLDAPAAVPEPQRALLLMAGLVALGLPRRRRCVPDRG